MDLNDNDEQKYVQQDFYDEESPEVDEGETMVNKPNLLEGKMKYIVLAAIVVIISLLLVMLSKVFSGDSKKEAQSSAEAIVNEVDNENKNSKDSTATNNESDSGEELIVADGADTDTIKNSDGNALGKAVNYSIDDIKKLRAAGYTATEMEEMSAKGEEVDSALQKAKALRDAYLMNLYKELQKDVQKDNSDSYKALVKDTWLGGDLRPVHKEENVMYDTKTLRENCRYTKVAPLGGELLLRLTLKNGDILYYNIHPSRYEKLDDEGNMVIDYDLITYGDKIYYLNIKEVPIEE